MIQIKVRVIKDYYTFIAILVITFIVGIFVGYTLTAVYAKDVFNKEVIVSVSPYGWTYNPYTNIRQKGRIDRQDFKVIFKNNIQRNDEWIGYTYE